VLGIRDQRPRIRNKTHPGSGTATLIYLPMVQIMVARVVKISTARDRVRTVNRSDSQNILQTKRIDKGNRKGRLCTYYFKCNVVDPHWFKANPDQAWMENADPDPGI
jgi:hypothetical protein